MRSGPVGRRPRRGRLPSAVDIVSREPVAASVVVEPAGFSITGKELTDPPARVRIVPHSFQGCYRTLLQPLRGTVDQCVNREEIARLRVENRALNDQVARHLGAARAASVTERF